MNKEKWNYVQFVFHDFIGTYKRKNEIKKFSKIFTIKPKKETYIPHAAGEKDTQTTRETVKNAQKEKPNSLIFTKYW